MSTLRLHLFGPPTVSTDVHQVHVSSSALSVLIYLAIHRGQTVGRDMLASTLWPDTNDERARRCLSTALWRLRQSLAELDGTQNPLIISTPSDITLNLSSDLWIDIEQFETCIRRCSGHTKAEISDIDADELERACSLYSGGLLEGFYQPWIDEERERLYILYLKGLEYLVAHCLRVKEFDKGLIFAKRILQLDPLQEQIHRAAMILYYKLNRPAYAVQQYKDCVTVLANQLGINPTRQSERLYQKILSQNIRLSNQRPAFNDALNLQELASIVAELKATSFKLIDACETLVNFLEAGKIPPTALDSNRDTSVTQV